MAEFSMSDDLRVQEIDEAIEGATAELRRKLAKAERRIEQLEAQLNVDLVEAHNNKVKILEKQIEVLEAVVRYWKWRVVGEADVAPGEEYLLET